MSTDVNISDELNNSDKIDSEIIYMDDYDTLDHCNRWVDPGVARSLTWLILDDEARSSSIIDASSPVSIISITTSSYTNIPNTNILSTNISSSNNLPRLLPEIWKINIPRFLHFDLPSPGMIYVCGGRCSKVLQPEHYLNTVEMYDPIRNIWVTLPSMRNKRVGAASIEVSGNVYVVGGYCDHPDKPLSSGECFDTLRGIWRPIASMNKARFGHAMSSVDNKFIYVIGGDCKRTLVREIERYDVVADQWDNIGEIPNPVAGGRMLEKDGKLYLVGGDIGAHPLSFTERIRVFDSKSKHFSETWETLPNSLDTGRSACAVTWCGEDLNMIAVIGGYATDSESFFELDSAEAISIDPTYPVRKKMDPLACPRAGCRAVSLGSRIYVIGGESPAPPPSSQSSSTADGSIFSLETSSTILSETNNLRSNLIDQMRRRLANMADQLIENLNNNNPNPSHPLPSTPLTTQRRSLNLSLSTRTPLLLEPSLFYNQLSSPTHNTPIPQLTQITNSIPSTTHNNRILHDEVVVFDTKIWKWISPSDPTLPPRMSISRTAAAICLGRGFSSSYGYDFDSKMEWKALPSLSTLSRKNSIAITSGCSSPLKSRQTILSSSG